MKTIQDTEITRVEFYVATYTTFEEDEQPTEEVVAVFIDTEEHDFLNCYAHLGQHSVLSKSFIAENCKKASQEEYQELFNELENLVGYKLKVV